MSQLLKLRFLDTSCDDNQYVEIYCDPADELRFAKFSKKTKRQLGYDDITIRPTKDLLFEAKTLGNTWRTIKRTEMEKYMFNINAARSQKGWDPIKLPETLHEKK